MAPLETPPQRPQLTLSFILNTPSAASHHAAEAPLQASRYASQAATVDAVQTSQLLPAAAITAPAPSPSTPPSLAPALPGLPPYGAHRQPLAPPAFVGISPPAFGRIERSNVNTLGLHFTTSIPMAQPLIGAAATSSEVTPSPLWPQGHFYAEATFNAQSTLHAHQFTTPVQIGMAEGQPQFTGGSYASHFAPDEMFCHVPVMASQAAPSAAPTRPWDADPKTPSPAVRPLYTYAPLAQGPFSLPRHPAAPTRAAAMPIGYHAVAQASQALQTHLAQPPPHRLSAAGISHWVPGPYVHMQPLQAHLVQPPPHRLQAPAASHWMPGPYVPTALLPAAPGVAPPNGQVPLPARPAVRVVVDRNDWLDIYGDGLTRIGFTEDQQYRLAQIAPRRARQELLRNAHTLEASGYSAEDWVSFLVQRGAGGYADTLFQHAQLLNRAGFTGAELYRFLWGNFANERLSRLTQDSELRNDMTAIERRHLLSRHVGNL